MSGKTAGKKALGSYGKIKIKKRNKRKKKPFT